MKIGDLIRLKNNSGEVTETLWEIVDFFTGDGIDFVNVKHPDIGGMFTFYAERVVEVE